MNMNETLSGGREGKIQKNGNLVIRPANPWTSDVQRFLMFLIEQRFTNVPSPYGINKDGNEVLSFVPGKAYNYPIPKCMRSDELLASAARLLKEYHRIGAGYIKNLTGKETWMILM